MEIIEKAIMPNGTEIQIEDWSKDYSCFGECSTIATYPISKITANNKFEYPKRHETFRIDMQFRNKQDAKICFEQLKNGEKQIIDFCDNKWKEFL